MNSGFCYILLKNSEFLFQWVVYLADLHSKLVFVRDSNWNLYSGVLLLPDYLFLAYVVHWSTRDWAKYIQIGGVLSCASCFSDISLLYISIAAVALNSVLLVKTKTWLLLSCHLLGSPLKWKLFKNGNFTQCWSFVSVNSPLPD